MGHDHHRLAPMRSEAREAAGTWQVRTGDQLLGPGSPLRHPRQLTDTSKRPMASVPLSVDQHTASARSPFDASSASSIR